jgi:hypothetical protein
LGVLSFVSTSTSQADELDCLEFRIHNLNSLNQSFSYFN